MLSSVVLAETGMGSGRSVVQGSVMLSLYVVAKNANRFKRKVRVASETRMGADGVGGTKKRACSDETRGGETSGEEAGEGGEGKCGGRSWG